MNAVMMFIVILIPILGGALVPLIPFKKEITGLFLLKL